MNRPQQIVLCLAALVVIIGGIFVPWVAVAQGVAPRGGRVRVQRACGYHWAFSQPDLKPTALFPDIEIAAVEKHIDTPRIYLQWVGVMLVTGLLVLSLAGSTAET